MMKRNQKNKLRKEIRFFGKIKGVVAIPLLFLGVLGLILPIIPGMVFLVLGIVLVIPSFEKKLIQWLGKNVEPN